MQKEYNVTIFERDGRKHSAVITEAELTNFNALTGVLTKPEQPAVRSFTQQRYFNLRDLSWQVLLKSGVDSLPLDLEAIATALGYTLLSYRKHAESIAIIDKQELRKQRQGFSLELLGRGIICYEEIPNTGRQRFTVAHEVGHLTLHHAVVAVEEYEKEANMFARRLLCPMGILLACRVSSVNELAALCGVSGQAAEFAYNRLQMLKERGKFYTSPLERQLVTNFQDFIDEYNARK